MAWHGMARHGKRIAAGTAWPTGGSTVDWMACIALGWVGCLKAQ
jgi:hypothetical protein